MRSDLTTVLGFSQRPFPKIPNLACDLRQVAPPSRDFLKILTKPNKSIRNSPRVTPSGEMVGSDHLSGHRKFPAHRFRFVPVSAAEEFRPNLMNPLHFYPAA
jgi:hypothetical protein